MGQQIFSVQKPDLTMWSIEITLFPKPSPITMTKTPVKDRSCLREVGTLQLNRADDLRLKTVLKLSLQTIFVQRIVDKFALTFSSNNARST